MLAAHLLSSLFQTWNHDWTAILASFVVLVVIKIDRKHQKSHWSKGKCTERLQMWLEAIFKFFRDSSTGERTSLHEALLTLLLYMYVWCEVREE